jgi:adenosylcobinamide-GDP ribazoletransferase
LIGALAFLTIIGRGRRPDANQQLWFPVVGAMIGALVGVVWWGAAQWWPPAVTGALAVAADLVITGLLHLDGLADSADGLLALTARV